MECQTPPRGLLARFEGEGKRSLDSHAEDETASHILFSRFFFWGGGRLFSFFLFVLDFGRFCWYELPGTVRLDIVTCGCVRAHARACVVGGGGGWVGLRMKVEPFLWIGRCAW